MAAGSLGAAGGQSVPSHSSVAAWEAAAPGQSATMPAGGAAGSHVIDWGEGSAATREGGASNAYGVAGASVAEMPGGFAGANLGDDAADGDMPRPMGGTAPRPVPAGHAKSAYGTAIAATDLLGLPPSHSKHAATVPGGAVSAHAKVTGTVFFDADGDGIQDPGEKGVEGYTMHAIDLVTGQARSADTAAGGTYAFERVRAGETTLIQTCFFPPGHTVAGAGSSWFSYASPAGGQTATFDVGFYPVPEDRRVTLDLTAFLDENRNGVMDAGEVGVGGLNLTVYTYAVGSATVTTDASGTVTRADLLPVDWAVTGMPGEYLVTAYRYERSDDTAGKFYDPTFLLADEPEPGSVHTIGIGLVRAGAGTGAGSISLDRGVYPVPIGPGALKMKDGSYLPQGELTVHVRVSDADYDLSAAATDTIDEPGTGPVRVSVMRGSAQVVLGYAGGAAPEGDRFGPIREIAPDAGIFEAGIAISHADGPESPKCAPGGGACVLSGDTILVEYADADDGSGEPNMATDSATFALRDAALQSDKTIYVVGRDILLTLTEPDFDLDSARAEAYPLNLIEWDSDAATLALGSDAAFVPEPPYLGETGTGTGIFQTVIRMPESLAGDTLDRAEEIQLEYADWGPSGSGYVGDLHKDVGATIYTSYFGATVELDQNAYTWTDKVYITIVAPDYNFDADLADEIGDTDSNPVKISTRGADLDSYKLVETGPDTGIFAGEVTLTGFTHDADGDTTTGPGGNDVMDRPPHGGGPTDGTLPSDDYDGITVSFEVSEDYTVVSSALIRWNIGEVQWLEAGYPADGAGTVRVIDPDMNLDPEAADSFGIDVWSETDLAGVGLTVTETGEATGIFEGTTSFTATDGSSAHTLRVAGGGAATAGYEDNTLPDPYTTVDERRILAVAAIQGTGKTVDGGGNRIGLDQAAYTWTDKVYVTIAAPGHNLDGGLAEEIGATPSDSVRISTRDAYLDSYKLVETGPDTGIFAGEVTLTGFAHDADGDAATGNEDGDDTEYRAPSGSGPTDGTLPTSGNGGVAVSFKFSEDETIVGSALVRWSIGEIRWLEASHPATGTGVVRVTDPDMNLDPEALDSFNVDVWSDSDAGGVDLTVTETGEATGIFEGTVSFAVTGESSGHRLRVAGGDTVTAGYEDNTLPVPYTTADELDISATSSIRAPPSQP